MFLGKSKTFSDEIENFSDWIHAPDFETDWHGCSAQQNAMSIMTYSIAEFPPPTFDHLTPPFLGTSAFSIVVKFKHFS